MIEGAITCHPDTCSPPHPDPHFHLKKWKTTEELTMALIPVSHGAKEKSNEHFLLTSNIEYKCICNINMYTQTQVQECF